MCRRSGGRGLARARRPPPGTLSGCPGGGEVTLDCDALVTRAPAGYRPSIVMKTRDELLRADLREARRFNRAVTRERVPWLARRLGTNEHDARALLKKASAGKPVDLDTLTKPRAGDAS